MASETTPVYNTRCATRFPFPAATDAQKARIRELGEQLDAHRKRQQAAHAGLTITDMYNVLEKLRAGEELTAKDKKVHEQGLVSVLKQIHDDLDAAVFDAYGWPADLSDEQILERLVALNHERAAEEARGLVRWLRPEFQNRGGATQATIDVPDDEEGDDAKPAKGKKSAKAAKPKAAKAAKLEWPRTLAEQARAVRAALATGGGATPAAMAKAAFKGAKVDRVEEILDTLVTLGQARRDASGAYRA